MVRRSHNPRARTLIRRQRLGGWSRGGRRSAAYVFLPSGSRLCDGQPALGHYFSFEVEAEELHAHKLGHHLTTSFPAGGLMEQPQPS